MAEPAGGATQNGIRARVRDSLFDSRWTLLASAAAVAGVWLYDGAWLTPVMAIAFIGLVAALAPRRTTSGRRTDEAAGTVSVPLGGVSAEGLAAAVSDPLVVFESGGGLIHANTAALIAFGGLFPGTPVQLKFRAPEMQDLVRRIVDTDALVASAEYLERVPVERVYRVNAAPIDRERGLFVLVFKDQSEVRRIDRMRADFIANASHELRTPLASIAGFIETLRGPARNDAKARENFLQIMQNQTGRMARLIDDLLSLSRIEMKSHARPGERLDVGAVVDGVIDALGHLASESGVVIARSAPRVPAFVSGDRDELTQVFENLLENAIKYGQSGGRVEATVEAGGDGAVTATVRDFGPGIAAEHIPRVTERFYRVDVETNRSQKGTGLGLSIVKHILTRHHARLSIRSEVGKGAAFVIHFPPPG
ncbi:MAG: ATP-binding protein [Rhizobiaceae bacterium]